MLQHFAKRKNIRFPLLSDAGSATIRAFGIFNDSIPSSNPFHGIPHPVTFLTDPKGVVQHKYFEEDYRERQTLAAILAREYNISPAAVRGEPKAKHVKLTTSASTAIVRSGQRILLAVDLELAPTFHVYAPGVEGYKPVAWELTPLPVYRPLDLLMPKSRVLFLEAIDEKVPVYEGKVRLLREITIGNDKAVKSLLGAGTHITIQGTLQYQACNDRLCFPPETVPLEWKLAYESHDRERAPADLRKKGL